MLLLKQPSHQETRLLSLQHGRRAKTIDLTARNGYFSMRTITGDRLRLLLQPHVVCLSGFRNLRAPLTCISQFFGIAFLSTIYQKRLYNACLDKTFPS